MSDKIDGREEIVSSILSSGLNSKHHVSASGEAQDFFSFSVTGRLSELDFPHQYSTEWVHMIDGKPYVCRTEHGECLIDYVDEYEGEDLPLVPFEVMEICASDKEYDHHLELATFALSKLASHLSFDASQVKIINVG